MSDSIFAAATPLSPATRGVIRCSGILLFSQIDGWLSEFASGTTLSKIRGVQHIRCELYSDFTFDIKLLVFCGPESATGEDVVEIHLPGNPVLIDKLCSSLVRHHLRAATPGEFTRRAFLNGRLDLSQAEAVLELVNSRSIESARAATQILSGSLGKQMTQVRDNLLQSLVELEAGLDFEEGDSQDLQPKEVTSYVNNAAAILGEAANVQRVRFPSSQSRFGCLLFGPPNAGKSSLFRAVTGLDSIVSGQAGTTRDHRRAPWSLPDAEMPFDLIDFPGLGGGEVDSRDAAARQLVADFNQADMCILCLHPQTKLSQLPALFPDMPVLVAFTHSDITTAVDSQLLAELQSRLGDNFSMISISTLAPQDELLSSFKSAVLPFFESNEQLAIQRIRNSERYQAALDEARAAVERACQWLEVGGQQDLIAAEIRAALDSLAELVGEMTPEEVLDRLFSAFCVGK
ncbi:MAG: 50S ribosome-binding GTPase [Planctomycetota bacterium]|nr:50S ribosome-binding GTPase [Planctomycetota bacterium]